jgi:transposase
LFFFPPACPDLNPQEHVWKLARDSSHATRSATITRLPSSVPCAKPSLAS